MRAAKSAGRPAALLDVVGGMPCEFSCGLVHVRTATRRALRPCRGDPGIHRPLAALAAEMATRGHDDIGLGRMDSGQTLRKEIPQTVTKA